MPSATSCFNGALFRKNLQRFWPLWFGYTLVWLMLLPLPLLRALTDRREPASAQDVAYALLTRGAYGGLFMAFVFGIFFAMALFSYLTNSRATQGFHAMPVRRETLYLTNLLTGLVCMISSIVLAFALAGVTAACFGALKLAALGKGLLAAMLAVVFFFSFGAFCMMFTGQLLAAPVFYGILSILAAGVEYLVRVFAGNFLYGYSDFVAPTTLTFLSPIWKLATSLSVRSVPIDDVAVYAASGEYTILSFSLLWIYAAVGVIFAALGLLVYRRRASEASGSIVTVPWARPIFKYGVAVCCALSLGQLIYFLLFGIHLSSGQYSLPGTIVCMLLSGLLGYFAAEMLLHKRFRVLRTGWAGALVFSAVLVCFGVAMSLDLTGYEGYTPASDEVQAATIYLSASGDYLSATLDEPESIECALRAHQALIADKDRQISNSGEYSSVDDGSAYLYFTVTYTLTDGRIVRRSYDDCRVFSSELGQEGSVAQTMTALLNCPEAAQERALGELNEDGDFHLTGGYYEVVTDGAYGEDSGELTAAQADTLRAALRRDYEAGHASNASLFEDTRYGNPFRVELELWYTAPEDDRPVNGSGRGTRSFYTVVTPGMTCTLEALAEMGVETSAFPAAF